MAGFEEGWGEEMDRKAHLSTYESFLSVGKWGLGGVMLVLVLMAITMV
ncbi:MAG: aa3-type cytochrome c oxidase subunit IV [Parvibaculum sp.]|nr:aa3-type cytochrome c oxidase subunit IV [Parvibaculum sp.]